jgi:60 kDa SS-A/Ro ribonucleoprotein
LEPGLFYLQHKNIGFDSRLTDLAWCNDRSQTAFILNFFSEGGTNMAKTYTNLNGTSKTKNLPQVVNNAGGVSFAVADKDKLERFLLMGTFGGTYYASEQKLTDEATQTLIKMIKSSPRLVLDLTTKFLVERRLLKVDTALYILALTVTHGSQEIKNEAYSLITTYCNTATHLFNFVSMANDLRGWSKGLCKGVSKWYTTKTEDQLVYQWLKYRQRNGWTHRDVLRLAHPTATNKRQDLIFAHMVGKDKAVLDNPRYAAFKEIQAYKEHEHDMATVVECIKAGELTWEMVPTELLNDLTVLKALAPGMPVMATIRNLNRFTAAGLFDRPTKEAGAVLKKLVDSDEVKNSGIHPVFVLNAIRTYAQGRGDLGSLTWTPNQRVLDALNETLNLSFANGEKSYQNVLVAVDTATGTQMSCKQLAAALALTNIKSMPNSKVITFTSTYQEAEFGARTSYDDVLKKLNHTGSTDCGQAFRYALDKKLDLDAIIIYTDNETWAGSEDSHELLAEYRKKYNKDVKVIEVAMVYNPFTNYPNDKNTMRTVGYDSNVPDVISKFLKS